MPGGKNYPVTTYSSLGSLGPTWVFFPFLKSTCLLSPWDTSKWGFFPGYSLTSRHSYTPHIHIHIPHTCTANSTHTHTYCTQMYTTHKYTHYIHTIPCCVTGLTHPMILAQAPFLQGQGHIPL